MYKRQTCACGELWSWTALDRSRKPVVACFSLLSSVDPSSKTRLLYESKVLDSVQVQAQDLCLWRTVILNGLGPVSKAGRCVFLPTVDPSSKTRLLYESKVLDSVQVQAQDLCLWRTVIAGLGNGPRSPVISRIGFSSHMGHYSQGWMTDWDWGWTFLWHESYVTDNNMWIQDLFFHSLDISDTSSLSRVQPVLECRWGFRYK